MHAPRFDPSWRQLASSTGRRDALHALAALGTGVLAAIGISAEAAAKSPGKARDKHRVQSEKKKSKPGPPGPSGPAGATGPAGPTGPASPLFDIIRVDGQASAPLGKSPGDQTSSTVACDQPGQLLSCSWVLQGTGTDFEGAIIESAPVEASDNLQSCKSMLTRTAPGPNFDAGQVIAIAICRR